MFRPVTFLARTGAIKHNLAFSTLLELAPFLAYRAEFVFYVKLRVNKHQIVLQLPFNITVIVLDQAALHPRLVNLPGKNFL
jgi:hypothetical protein